MGCATSKRFEEPIYLPYSTVTWTLDLSFDQRTSVHKIISVIKGDMKYLARPERTNEHTEEILAIYGALLNQLDDKTILLNKSVNRKSFKRSSAFQPGLCYPTLDLPTPPTD